MPKQRPLWSAGWHGSRASRYSPLAIPTPRPPRPFWRLARWAVVTAGTAFLSRRLGEAVEGRPVRRRPGPPAAGAPLAAQAQQRLADTPAWRWIESRLARRALRPFQVCPSLQPLRVLSLDHGPGGLACALAQQSPQDATIVATDPVVGMAELLRHRAARRGGRAALQLGRAWAGQLPFCDGAFDLVISAGALHQWPDPEAALAEVRRVISPSGRYLIADVRRDLALPLWILLALVQAWVVPRALREKGEPGTSIHAAYAPQEAEWLAARARLPSLLIRLGPLWLMIEGGAMSAS